jgi:HSP20 family protein
MALLPSAWDPWSELSSLHQSMDRVFNTIFGPFSEQGQEGSGRVSVYMPANVTETDASYHIQAPVPGFSPEEIDVTFVEGLLTMKAQHRQAQQAQQGQILRREFLWADMVRQLSLPGEVDPDKIEARVENGLLTVTVPKTPRAQPRRIPIGSQGTRAELAGSTSS